MPSSKLTKSAEYRFIRTDVFCSKGATNALTKLRDMVDKTPMRKV